MPNSKITDIKYKNSFDSQYGGPDGKMHSHIISFEDGIVGTANTKTLTPYYKVGDEMTYTIAEQNKYGYKLKIEKVQPGMESARSAHQPNQPGSDDPVPTDRPTVQPVSPVNGPTAGMATKTALELMSLGLSREDMVKQVSSPSFWQAVYEMASDVVRVMQKIESGNLAKPVNIRGSARPKPGPGGSVSLDHHADFEESTPF